MQPLRTILYYERDHDIMAETLFSLREKGGLDVHAFETFDASLGHLEGLKANIILLSLEMPDISGVELLHKLRKYDNLAHSPAIFFTSQSLDNKIINNNDVGIVDILRKPMRGADLIIRLHEVWGEFDGKLRE